MYRKSKSSLWHYLETGFPGEVKVSLEAATQYWKTYFEKESIIEREPPVHLGDGSGAWTPLTHEEVNAALFRQRGKAMGLDGVGFDRLRKVPITIIQAFLNACMWLKTVPECLKKNRTALIPKKGNSEDPAHYRPITVGPMLVRILHSVLAGRLNVLVKFHYTQRGFVKADGCLENVTLLDWVIRNTCSRNARLYILLLDIAKAFDTVSRHSILRAGKCFGLHSNMIQYLAATMADSTTRLNIRGVLSEEIAMTVGVKQGDPLSPLLFNMVVDELLQSLPTHIGIDIGDGFRINNQAFADDLVLVSESESDMKRLVEDCVTFLEKRGMRLNPEKCVLMCRIAAPGLQLCALSRETDITIYGSKPRCIYSDQDLYTYLGIQFNPNGKRAPNMEVVRRKLGLLETAPLKPEQKLYFLRTHLIPSVLHEAVLGRLNNGLLEQWDHEIRSFVKRVCFLPRWAIDGLFYMPINKGGMGIVNLRFAVPQMLLNRIERLGRSDNPLIQRWLGTVECLRLKAKLNDLLTTSFSDQSYLLNTAKEACKYWTDRTLSTADGKGVAEYASCPPGNRWILGYSKVLSGKTFNRAV
jgi:hypothetical protein